MYDKCVKISHVMTNGNATYLSVTLSILNLLPTTHYSRREYNGIAHL